MYCYITTPFIFFIKKWTDIAFINFYSHPPPINSVNIHAKKNNNTGSKHTHNTL